jgi:hypothetical protein
MRRNCLEGSFGRRGTEGQNGRILQCRGCSSESLDLIEEVVARLPTEPQSFARSRVVFVAVGERYGHGQTWKHSHLSAGSSWGDPRGNWVVVVAEDSLTERLIAHEIAHAFLGHDSEGADVRGRRICSQLSGVSRGSSFPPCTHSESDVTGQIGGNGQPSSMPFKTAIPETAPKRTDTASPASNAVYQSRLDLFSPEQERTRASVGVPCPVSRDGPCPLGSG